MSQEANIAAQQKFGDAVNSGQLDLLDDLVAEDAVDNDPAPGQGGLIGSRRTATHRKRGEAGGPPGQEDPAPVKPRLRRAMPPLR